MITKIKKGKKDFDDGRRIYTVVLQYNDLL